MPKLNESIISSLEDIIAQVDKSKENVKNKQKYSTNEFAEYNPDFFKKEELIYVTEQKSHYFYIQKNKIQYQKIKDYIPSIRRQIKEVLGLQAGDGFQIIGDSATFSSAASAFLMTQLTKEVKDHQGPIYYGFTGSGANGIVGNLLKKNLLLPEQVIANIVANESLQAMKEWKCEYSEQIKNFIIVGDGKGGCQFGDDIELSDHLAEKLICLEGGMISFTQLVNTLMYHPQPKITIYTGLRDEKHAASIERPLFSAAEFLLALKLATSVEQMKTIKKAYLISHRFNPINNEENSNKEQQVSNYFEKLMTLAKDTILEKLKNIAAVHFKNEPVNSYSLRK